MEGQWGGEVEEDAADARRDTLHAIPLTMDARPIRLASTLQPLLGIIPVFERPDTLRPSTSSTWVDDTHWGGSA